MISRKALNLVAIVLGAVAIALGAQISVPMMPVPMTLQTLAVLLAGGMLGHWRGVAAAALYLALGVSGAPVFAGGQSATGAEFLELKSAGYLAMFPVAAWIAGIGTRHPMRVLGCMVLAHAAVLAGGAVVLARHVGGNAAWTDGVVPFIPGVFVKSVLAAAVTVRARGVRREDVS